MIDWPLRRVVLGATPPPRRKCRCMHTWLPLLRANRNDQSVGLSRELAPVLPLRHSKQLDTSPRTANGTPSLAPSSTATCYYSHPSKILSALPRYIKSPHPSKGLLRLASHIFCFFLFLFFLLFSSHQGSLRQRHANPFLIHARKKPHRVKSPGTAPQTRRRARQESSRA